MSVSKLTFPANTFAPQANGTDFLMDLTDLTEVLFLNYIYGFFLEIKGLLDNFCPHRKPPKGKGTCRFLLYFCECGCVCVQER